MYTILVNNDNSLIISEKERIMQRSKLVDSLHFLVLPEYKEHSMADFNVVLKYKTPISQEPKTENLVLTVDDNGEPVLYKNMLEYKLDIDTNFTAEAGKLEIWLTFYKNELDTEGRLIQRLRNTSLTYVDIIPVAAWTAPSDHLLDVVDQKLLQVDAMIHALDEMAYNLDTNKADNIDIHDTVSVDDEGNETHKKVIQLQSNGSYIGNEIGLGQVVSDGSDEILEDPEMQDGIFKVVTF